jgi:hypothetical protein
MWMEMLAPERPNQKKTNRRWPWISEPPRFLRRLLRLRMEPS